MRLSPTLLRAGGLASLASLTLACNAVLGVDDVSLLPPEAPPDTPAACNVASDFPLVVSNPSTTSLIHRMDDGGPTMLFLLNTNTTPDALAMLLYDNMGGHGTLNTPGTYSINAADSKVETCGICLAIYVDFDLTTSTFSQIFLALGQGTLTLTKADSTGLAGRLRNLKFRHVDLANDVTREVNDGCSVTIADVQFDMPYSQ